jgi:hypothetical protein
MFEISIKNEKIKYEIIHELLIYLLNIYVIKKK